MAAKVTLLMVTVLFMVAVLGFGVWTLTHLSVTDSPKPKCTLVEVQQGRCR